MDCGGRIMNAFVFRLQSIYLVVRLFVNAHGETQMRQCHNSGKGSSILSDLSVYFRGLGFRWSVWGYGFLGKGGGFLRYGGTDTQLI